MLLKNSPPPDVIISNDPPQIPALACGMLAKRMNVPLLLDVIDLWPELFATALPRKLRRFSRLLFSPLFCVRRRNFRQASAITAVCDSYGCVVKKELTPGTAGKVTTIFWSVACDQAERDSTPGECSTPYQTLEKRNGEVWAVYAGMLGQGYDLETLLNAAKLATTSSKRLRFVIAGEGPRKNSMKARIAQEDLWNVLFIGPISAVSLGQLYRQCDVGLCTYNAGSTVGMPVKVFDYFAAGLPIISSLEGDIKALLRDNGAGVNYRAGDAGSLLECISDLADSQSKRSSMAERSQALGLRFDTQTQYGKFADIIEKVVCEFSAHSHSGSMASTVGSNG